MHLEEQRWLPVAASCTPSWGSVPEGVGLNDWPKPGSADFLVYNWGDGWRYCFTAKACTEYASYPNPSSMETSWGLDQPDLPGDPNSWISKALNIGPTRMISLNHGYWQNWSGASLNVTFVANDGPAARKWWWSGFQGATAAQLSDVINGKAWGHIKKDGVKKRLVGISRSKLDGKFLFILNEWKGEAWWWGYGASIANITSVINGKAWADFPKDGIEKRLVSLKRHKGGNWTFIMVPRNGLGWSWHPKITADDLVAYAKKYNQRVIAVTAWDDAYKQQPSPADRLTAVLVQNT
jgi:hypothetical protein